MPRHARRLAFAALGLAVLASGSSLQAQEFPNKPIRIIAPFAAGTGPDVNTREIAAELQKVLGQSVVVENRPGAANMIGMEAGARAPADGYNLTMGTTTSMSVVPHLYNKVPYKVSDFAPISIVGLLNTALTANAGLKESNAAELIARLKAEPGSIRSATQGPGSYFHLAGEWFAARAGVKIQFVPYNTTSPYSDLVAGQVDVMFDALPAAIGNVRSGKLKVLAITGRARHPSFPDVPTFAEAGVTDYTPTAWVGVFAPAATPKAIVDKLGEAMQKAGTQNAALIERWRGFGGEMRPMTPEAFAEFIRQDNAMWGKVIRDAGIKLDL
jgi:tripartite-type tricarboxylate transporter receptor subunit TctC